MTGDEETAGRDMRLLLAEHFMQWRTRRLLDRFKTVIAHTGGGEWNGLANPKPLDVVRDVWGYRELIFELAFQKTVARYRSFFLGPLWIILGFAAFAFGIAFLVTIMRERSEFDVFVPYVVVGLFAWNIMTGVLGEGTRCLLDNRGMIHQSGAPILIYPFVVLLKQVILGAHTLVVVIPVLILFPPDWSIDVLWAVPAYALLLIFGVAFAVILSIACAYLPDLGEIISSGIRFAFFFTPIMWMPEMRPQYAYIWGYNPLYYIVEGLRGPILGTSNPAVVVPVLAGMALISVAIATMVYARWARGARIRV